MYDLRKEIFQHLQRLPMSFFDRSPVGRLVTRATTDVDALNDLFASGVVAMLNDFVQLFGMAMLSLVVASDACPCHSFAAPLHGGCSRTFSEITFAAQTAAFARPSPVSTASCRNTSAAWPWCSFSIVNARPAAIRRTEPRLHGSVQGRDQRLRFFLPRGGVFEHGRHRAALLGRWRACNRRDNRCRSPHIIHDVCAALLPADSGFEREIQYLAGCHGGLRTYLSTAR